MFTQHNISKKFFPVLAANVLKPVDRREKNTRQGVAPQDTRDVQLATQTCVHKQTTNKKLVTPCVQQKLVTMSVLVQLVTPCVQQK